MKKLLLLLLLFQKAWAQPKTEALNPVDSMSIYNKLLSPTGYTMEFVLKLIREGK